MSDWLIRLLLWWLLLFCSLFPENVTVFFHWNQGTDQLLIKVMCLRYVQTIGCVKNYSVLCFYRIAVSIANFVCLFCYDKREAVVCPIWDVNDSTLGEKTTWNRLSNNLRCAVPSYIFKSKKIKVREEKDKKRHFHQNRRRRKIFHQGKSLVNSVVDCWNDETWLD